MPSETRHPGKRRVSTTLVLLAIAAVIALGLVVVFAAVRGWAAKGWVAAALGGRLFLVCGLVLAGCLALLVVLGGAMWAAGAAQRRKPRGQEGAIMIEFALVLPIALMLVLLMAQCSLVMVGTLCVNYSAYCAARSAIVNIPNDLSPTEPPNLVNSDQNASGKYRRVKLAAMWAVLPVSCSSTDVAEGDATALRTGLDSFFTRYGQSTPYWAQALLGRKLQYAEDYTTVALSPPLRDNKYAAHEDVTVSVQHTFYLAVPYAAKLFASFGGVDGVPLPFGQNEYGLILRSQSRLTNEGEQDFVEVEHF